MMNPFAPFRRNGLDVVAVDPEIPWVTRALFRVVDLLELVAW